MNKAQSSYEFEIHFTELACALDRILTANVMTASTNPDLLASDFRQLLEISLWGNRSDLSLSAGNIEVCFYLELMCLKKYSFLNTVCNFK